jgi:hypothetical protein
MVHVAFVKEHVGWMTGGKALLLMLHAGCKKSFRGIIQLPEQAISALMRIFVVT